MAKYTVLTNGSVKDNELDVIIPKDPLNRDYERYLAWKDGINLMGGTAPKHTPDYEIKRTLSDLKEIKIAELKAAANSILSQTDWYVIRNQETRKEVPSNVANYRNAVRSYVAATEKTIQAITTMDAINSITFKFPS